MNKKEEFKTYVINCCIAGTLTVKQAAKKLCFYERYVKKLKRSFRDNERNTLLHGNCGRQPKVTIDSNIKSKILEIRALPEFEEVNNLHFKEILEEKYNIKISYSSLSKLFKNNSIVSQRTHKKRKYIKEDYLEKKLVNYYKQMALLITSLKIQIRNNLYMDSLMMPQVI